MKILLLTAEELYSTRRFREAAERRDCILDIFEITDFTFVSNENGSAIFVGSRDIVHEYDALVVRSILPYVSETLTLARMFADAGKLVIDEALTTEGCAITKMHDYMVLAQNKIEIPRTWQAFDIEEMTQRAEALGYPCLLKGVHGSHGNHVFKIDSPAELRRRLRRYPHGALSLQEFLPGEVDYRVLTIGYHAVPLVIQRAPPPGDFRTNFAVGGTFTLAPESARNQRMIKLAEKSAKVLCREFAGVDIRWRGDTPLVLEVNRRPDFAGFERAAEADIAGRFIEYVLAKKRG